jgi:hypothetical protein
MKFAKLLRVTAVDLDEVEYILSFYKDAKKVLKSWPVSEGRSGDGDTRLRDERFVATLQEHLKTFNEKWEDREKLCKARYVEQQQQVILSAARSPSRDSFTWRNIRFQTHPRRHTTLRRLLQGFVRTGCPSGARSCGHTAVHDAVLSWPEPDPRLRPGPYTTCYGAKWDTS